MSGARASPRTVSFGTKICIEAPMTGSQKKAALAEPEQRGQSEGRALMLVARESLTRVDFMRFSRPGNRRFALPTRGSLIRQNDRGRLLPLQQSYANRLPAASEPVVTSRGMALYPLSFRSQRMSVDRSRFACRILAVLLPTAVVAQQPAQPLPLKHAAEATTAPITPADLMTRVYIFADDSMMGREVGTPYNLKGTAYIERELRRIGLQPGGDSGTFFQNLPIFNRVLAPGATFTVDDKKFSAGTDFIPRDNSVFGKVRSLDGVTAV